MRLKQFFWVLLILGLVLAGYTAAHAGQVKWERESQSFSANVNATTCTEDTLTYPMKTYEFAASAADYMDFLIAVPQSACSNAAIKDITLSMAKETAMTPSTAPYASNSTWEVESKVFSMQYAVWSNTTADTDLTTATYYTVNATGASDDMAAGQLYRVPFAPSIVGLEPGDLVLVRVGRVGTLSADNSTDSDAVMSLEYFIQTCYN